MTREERRRKERWLRRYRDGLAEERRLRGEMREVRERLASTSAALDGMPRASGRDRLACGMDKLAQYQQELEATIAEIIEVRCETERAIGALPDIMQRNVLRARYLEGMSWDKVARLLHISERTAYYTRDAALERLEIPKTEVDEDD